MHILIFIQPDRSFPLLWLLNKEPPHKLLQPLTKLVVVGTRILDILQPSLHLLLVILLLTAEGVDQIHHVVALLAKPYTTVPIAHTSTENEYGAG
jgi:hypothetical protein